MQDPTTELTRKYDFARLTASEVESEEEARRDFRMPVESSAWIRSSGRAVVLLNAMAGVTQLGSLNPFVAATPIAIETQL